MEQAYLRRGEAKRRLKHYDEAVADGKRAIACAEEEPAEKQHDLKREAEQLIEAVEKEVRTAGVARSCTPQASRGI